MSTELSWSAFLRQPTRIDALLKKGEVVLRRRDAEPLRISRADKDDVMRDVLAAAARLLAGVWTGTPQPALEVRAADQLPWTRFLPESDRRAFAVAFLKQFEACADLGDFSALGRLFAEWKATAAVYAEGFDAELKRPIASVGDRVRRPER